MLLNLAERKDVAAATDRPSVLTVGDSAYPGNRVARLPFTATESHWVKEAYEKQGLAATQLLGERATEASVRSQVSGRRIVHLACHGVAEESYGNLFGALLLMPQRDGTSADVDGFLTLGEIYGLDLRGCELAILSACQTNFGLEQFGEGSWALTRGFHVAGARRVVSSNWQVDDRAAASLISYFCSHAAKSTRQSNYAESLQAAKQWTRNQDQWSSPYYWSAYVLVGPD